MVFLSYIMPTSEMDLWTSDDYFLSQLFEPITSVVDTASLNAPKNNNYNGLE
jgi:hypothetical protein